MKPRVDQMWRRLGALALVLVTATVTVPVAASALAAAGPGASRAGDVAIVDIHDPNRLVTSGGSSTDFALRLSSDARCPGDSMHDQWRVQGFLVPVAQDPATISYGFGGPTGSVNQALWDVSTEPVSDLNTLPNTEPGQPAAIQTPALWMGSYAPGSVAPGTYRLGVACTLHRVTARYWDTEIVVSADPTDQPAHLHWSVPHPAALGPVVHHRSPWQALLFALAAVLALALVVSLLWGRASRRPPSPSSPSEE